MSDRDRRRLANRRMQISHDFAWKGLDLTLSVGFDRDGAVREVFADGLQSGTDVGVLVSDAAILVSMVLQHGYSAEQLLGRLMRARPADAVAVFKDEETGNAKLSLIAVLLREAIAIESEEGAPIAALHRAMTPQAGAGDD